MPGGLETYAELLMTINRQFFYMDSAKLIELNDDRMNDCRGCVQNQKPKNERSYRCMLGYTDYPFIGKDCWAYGRRNK